MKKRITFDFETRSKSDLKKEGAYKYSLDPTTRPTCLSIKRHGQDRVLLLKFGDINKKWSELPAEFRKMWKGWIDDGFEFSAHNAFFETCIYKNILVARYGWPDIPFRQFRCTAAKAAACALPRNLEGAGESMALSVQKDKRGYAAMMATCKPTRAWNAWKKLQDDLKAGKRVSAKRRLQFKTEPPMFLEYADNPATWETLYTYCKIDTRSEEKLDDALPDLIPSEQEIWFLNQRLNWRGLRVDIPTIKKIVEMMAGEDKVKRKELDTLTMGLITKPGAIASIREFLALEGIELPNLRAKTVEDVLKGGDLSPDMKRLLEIRQALSKTSTKKYQSFLHRAGVDGRVRDILLYHGASTGRDTGTGIQPHNFPRGLIKVNKERPYATVENVGKYQIEDLKLLYGDSLAVVFSSILRNMILPPKGCELFVGDFSKIEVAVLWWLADNWPGLDVLNSGKDPYKYQAAANTGKTYEEIEDEGDERQLGKAQVLGCGFRMSWKRFQETAWDQYRLKLTRRQSYEAVKSYREANKAVVDLWSIYENAAVEAIESGEKVKAGKCVFFVRRGFLWVKLPSGRKLAYRQPSIIWKTITYTALEKHPVTGKDVEVQRTSEPKKTVQFFGLDKSKKKLQVEFTHGGILTENITQAVARDLMMPAMVRLEKAKYLAMLMVHDEALTARKAGKGSVKEFEAIMCARPAWADSHLPIQAKAWTGPRYRK